MRNHLILVFLGFAVVVAAQVNSGTIVGSITDPQRLVVTNANISLENDSTGDIRRTTSNEAGVFSFPGVLPGTYTLRVEKAGFQKVERRNLVLSAGAYLPAGTIALTLGSTSEVVTVTGAAIAVETASSENSALVSSSQLNTMMTRGRDVVSLLRLLPGVTQTSDIQSLGGTNGTSISNVNGQRTLYNTMSVDGQISNAGANTALQVIPVSMDAIQEVKVLLNNYQAEYGHGVGAQVTIITKSGTRAFHGSLSWFVRNEAFNANDFFNNRNGIARPLYRYNNGSGTLGGPIYLPNRFNSNRNKLFFFYAIEDWQSHQPQTVTYSTMPSALERQGNYSQTLDLSGKVVTITDPTTRAPFPGNIIPANRINPYGPAILNIFPLPQPQLLNRTITGGAYNYAFQDIWKQPKLMNQFRADYNITDADRLSVRYNKWNANTEGYTGLPVTITTGFPLLYSQYIYWVDSLAVNYMKLVRSNLVSEFTATGRNLGQRGSAANMDPVLRSAAGLSGLGQLYSTGNSLGLIPSVTFGGVPDAPSILLNNTFPAKTTEHRWSLADNITWTRGTHMFKVGFYFEKNYDNAGWRGSPRGGCVSSAFSSPNTGSASGGIDFSVNATNPLNSNYAYSNAILGNFNCYSESSALGRGASTNYLADWFLQDSWKITRRLTLEIGMRFASDQPWQLRSGEKGASFVLAAYNPSQAPALFRPALDSAGNRVARNPVTGELMPVALIGAYVPGTGNPYNGMVAVHDPNHPSGNYPNGWRYMMPPQLEPRFGFAYDVFGDGKTAIRGAFSDTKEALFNSGYITGDTATSPPVVEIPTIYSGNFSTFRSATGYLFPPTFVPAWEQNYKPASAYSYAFNVQRNVGFSTVVSAGYVGNLGRHLLEVRNLNTLPYGEQFLPQSQDPTSPNQPLPNAFLVPLPGYSTVSLAQNSAVSSYSALQVTANRRFAAGVQFGVAWTFSKAMDLTDSTASVPQYQPNSWLWGKAGYDQRQVLVLNYIWDVPKGSKIWPNPLTRFVLDHWQLAGITTFASGSPLGISYTTTDNANILGGGDGARINVTGNPNLSSSLRTFYSSFNTTVFARPAKGDRGNAPKDVFIGPGINDWDLSVFKSFPILSEKRTIQFRGEFYNVFNHTQYSGVNTTARFDPAGNQVNSQFGWITSTRTPRVVQLALTFRF